MNNSLRSSETEAPQERNQNSFPSIDLILDLILAVNVSEPNGPMAVLALTVTSIDVGHKVGRCLVSR